MKQFQWISSWEYDWKISIPYRQLMFADEARIEYGDKKKKTASKEELDAVAEANRKINEAIKARKAKSE